MYYKLYDYRCNVCHLHLGWEFRTERDIQPKTFWALTRFDDKFC